MSRLITTAMALVSALICCPRITAQPLTGSQSAPSPSGSPNRFLLSPPKVSAPIIVRVRFVLNDINEINEGNETFEFAGVLTLIWNRSAVSMDISAVVFWAASAHVWGGDLVLLASYL